MCDEWANFCFLRSIMGLKVLERDARCVGLRTGSLLPFLSVVSLCSDAGMIPTGRRGVFDDQEK